MGTPKPDYNLPRPVLLPIRHNYFLHITRTAEGVALTFRGQSMESSETNETFDNGSVASFP